ncbi:YceI family protein [Nocardioides marmoribigeumensis]|jgi:polyisoprenoid-binding protein YceI|uniref:Polyisoprenoid-binding protein YceI n=1 Tax=Nocardioides marmoribigeumensis TaxID=433649 RepID=A0ABU2BW63_9ACTN|nr:YceI family protein [Nocardioides marmoribigeumensis]MDR7362875.1 polyisoprenoid-binding protein YceI [Nocardioides marmoribigeumensis]
MTATASQTVTLQDLDGTYVLDASHSRMGFVARHAMVTKVRGSFNDFSGSATTGAGLADARIEVAIKADSITTGNADRDGHLRSGDFFGTDEHAELTFVSTSVEAVDAETLRVTGDLTIKGVAKPVTIDFEYAGAATDPFGNLRVGFEGSTVIKRSDYGITWNAALEAGGVLVSDKVTLEIEISAIKQA